MQKASDAQLLAAYAEHRSVWKAAAALGMCGQSVHERLAKIGATKPVNVFTAAERDVLIMNYSAAAGSERLDDLANTMGRTKQFICRQARALGLTDPKRPRPADKREKRCETSRAWHKANEHPRGMLGKRHSPEAREKMSKYRLAHPVDRATKSARVLKAMQTKAANGTLAPKTREGASWKAGWREIGGQRSYYRSRWEANYARYLEWLKERGVIARWEHEPETFWFLKIKRGARSYLPDFRVTELSGAVAYHEVKGWMDPRSVTKIKRMRLYHPSVKLLVIDRAQYRSISLKAAALVPGWEQGRGDTSNSIRQGMLL